MYAFVGKFIDFIVPWSEDPAELGKNIIRNLVVGRLKAKKPCIIFLAGDSGEGKSYTGLKILEIINEYYGVETDVKNQVIYTPLDYTKKINKLLFDKEFKNYRILMIDEAREALKAQLWYSFVNQALADINAMMRRVKPMAIIVISQFIKDIDVQMRRTLNYYGKCMRPLGKRTRLKLYTIWKDDTDIERPVLRKRPLRGFVIKNGKYITFKPKFFEITLPSEKVIEEYEAINYEEKSSIIKRKLDLLLRQIQKELGQPYDKVEMLADWYAKHPESIHLVLEKKRGRMQLRKDVRRLHDLTADEAREFERRLMEKLAEAGILAKAGLGGGKSGV